LAFLVPKLIALLVGGAIATLRIRSLRAGLFALVLSALTLAAALLILPRSRPALSECFLDGFADTVSGAKRLLHVQEWALGIIAAAAQTEMGKQIGNIPADVRQLWGNEEPVVFLTETEGVGTY